MPIISLILTDWERHVDAKEHALASEADGTHEEACRVTFRDLVEQLGYQPHPTDG